MAVQMEAWVECPDCLGSGVRACGVCGDDASVIGDREPYCRGCDPAAEPPDGEAFSRLGDPLQEQYERAWREKRAS